MQQVRLMTTKTVKRSITMTSEMHDLLVQIASRRGRKVTEVDLIREAINEYLERVMNYRQ